MRDNTGREDVTDEVPMKWFFRLPTAFVAAATRLSNEFERAYRSHPHGASEQRLNVRQMLVAPLAPRATEFIAYPREPPADVLMGVSAVPIAAILIKEVDSKSN